MAKADIEMYSCPLSRRRVGRHSTLLPRAHPHLHSTYLYLSIITSLSLSIMTATTTTTTTTTTNNDAPTFTRRQDFEAVFPKLVDELLDYMRHEGMPKDAVDWYSKVS